MKHSSRKATPLFHPRLPPLWASFTLCWSHPLDRMRDTLGQTEGTWCFSLAFKELSNREGLKHSFPKHVVSTGLYKSWASLSLTFENSTTVFRNHTLSTHKRTHQGRTQTLPWASKFLSTGQNLSELKSLKLSSKLLGWRRSNHIQKSERNYPKSVPGIQLGSCSASTLQLKAMTKLQGCFQYLNGSHSGVSRLRTENPSERSQVCSL